MTIPAKINQTVVLANGAKLCSKDIKPLRGKSRRKINELSSIGIGSVLQKIRAKKVKPNARWIAGSIGRGASRPNTTVQMPPAMGMIVRRGSLSIEGGLFKKKVGT
tara:strand:- start:2716 stop:3033 length:318 start_codon:yes stop_codon:yes gene_type:complete